MRCRRKALSLLLGIAALALVPGLIAAEDDDIPELDEVVRSAPENGAQAEADDESVRDLEKLIETDEAPPAPSRAAAAPKKAPEPLPEKDLAAVTEEPKAEQKLELVPGEERAPSPKAPQGERNLITNLEFKMDGTTSRLVVTSRYALQYREIKNPGMKQVIYYFDNTETPERLQRAYDTSEFVSPVALFTLLQMPKEPSSKLIIQLREPKDGTVIATDRGLYIDFPAPSKSLESAPRLLIGGADGNQATEENIYLNNQTYTGRTIRRLEIKNSDVQDVLRLIAKTSGYNIVVGDDVGGKVGTLSLENVPWDQAFALVLQSKKLGYVKQGNVIRVATLATLKSEKEDALQNEQAKIKVEPLRTVLIPISYAKASELALQAKNFLTERGTVDIDNRTNTIIVKDVTKVVERVQKLFAALDTQPPRVAISAKIVEMKSNFSRNVGFSRLNFGSNFSGVNLSFGQTLETSGTNTFTLTAPQFANLDTQFQLGELEQKVKTLANPSVTVVANRQATVSQSLSFFVQDSSVAGGAVVPTSRQVTTTLTMDVTPIVAGDGSIFMTLNIKNEIPTLRGANTTIDARSVNTQVLLENGDTAVVGGVFTNTVNTDKEGLPLFMRIPVIGQVFSRNSINDRRNEIFIFVTARITNAEESFRRSL